MRYTLVHAAQRCQIAMTNSPSPLPLSPGERGCSASHNLATLLLKNARRLPSLPAIAIGHDIRNTYRALAARTTRLAASMRSAKLVPGDRVGIVAKNSAEYIEAMFACWHAGVCAVPV